MQSEALMGFAGVSETASDGIRGTVVLVSYTRMTLVKPASSVWLLLCKEGRSSEINGTEVDT